MIKCKTCPYFVADNKGYPYCCLYCKDLDFVAIHNLCAFADKEIINDNRKNKDDEITG